MNIHERGMFVTFDTGNIRRDNPMSHVIKIVGGKDGKASPLTGQYVRVYEPRAFGGKGNLELTDSAIRAHRFETSEDATAYVEMQNDKGERPLADFAVEIVPL